MACGNRGCNLQRLSFKSVVCGEYIRNRVRQALRSGKRSPRMQHLIEEKPQPREEIHTSKDLLSMSTAPKPDIIPKRGDPSPISTSSAIPNTDLQALYEKVKSMMEKGRKMIPDGKHSNGTPKQKKIIYLQSVWERRTWDFNQRSH